MFKLPTYPTLSSAISCSLSVYGEYLAVGRQTAPYITILRPNYMYYLYPGTTNTTITNLDGVGVLRAAGNVDNIIDVIKVLE